MSAPQLTVYQNGPNAVVGDQLNTFMQTCNTAAEMRGLIGVTGMSLYARGILSPNDGSGGAFYWNSSSAGPDDGANTIVPTGAKRGAWVRQTNTLINNPFYALANIAALRAATSVSLVASVCYVEGYYSGADGGEGMFWLDTSNTISADNGGTVIVDATGRRWHRELGAAARSVKQFGAHGDTTRVYTSITIVAGGTTLIAASAAFISADVGKTIIVPGAATAGTFLMTTILSVVGPAEVTLSAPANTSVNTTTSLMYGSDDTAAINATIATGKELRIPAGGYLVTDQLRLATPGQFIFGDGVGPSALYVPMSFNMSSLGVAVMTGGEPGPILQDFRIEFQQADTSDIAAIVQYPPAIYAIAQPRFQLRSMGIWHAWVGIDMTGNSGGACIDNLDLSMYNLGINIDGALDTIKITRLHCWPFGMTATQEVIFFTPAVIGVSSGRCDGLFISDSLFINGSQVQLFQSSLGNTFGVLSNVDFDTNTGLLMKAGDLSISNSVFTIGVVNIPAIFQTGGTLRVNGCMFLNGFGGTFPIVDVDTTSSSGTSFVFAQLTGCLFQMDAADVTTINASGSAVIPVAVEVSNCVLTKNAGTNYAQPVIWIRGNNARASISNSRLSDQASGFTTVFINIEADNFHRVIGNVSPGSTNTLPTATEAVYAYN